MPALAAVRRAVFTKDKPDLPLERVPASAVGHLLNARQYALFSQHLTVTAECAQLRMGLAVVETILA